MRRSIVGAGAAQKCTTIEIARTTTIITSIVVHNRMLSPHKPHLNLVFPLSSLFSIKHHFTSLQPPPPPPQSSSHSTQKSNKTHLHKSPVNLSGIAKSVILRCSHLWDKKGETFPNPSPKHFLLNLSNISPETARKFLRNSELKPEDVLQILLAFETDSSKLEIEAKRIESLWGIFKWASEQSKDFRHLPQSFKTMASLLVRVGLYRDAEFLLSKMESEGVLLHNNEIFSNLIEGYVGASELESAISVYDKMRGIGLAPSFSCYQGLLNYLVQMGETHFVFRVYLDMVHMGLGIAEKGIYENVIRLLCSDGKVQEARTLVHKVTTLGMEPSNFVLNSIASEYCEKKDYDDILSFFAEMYCPPDIVIGNKIINSLCRNFGLESAILFMQELEHLGYCPDEITYAILIGWSCREGKLKNAFIFLSEVLSRGLKPHIYSYNALISGLFEGGMWNHGRDILHEMAEIGVTPDMSTYRVLLAGYCKARQFDEVKSTVGEMVDRNLINLSSLEEPLAKAFTLLGLNPFSVKVRRDNDKGFSKTEFFDKLGNGLYLETDVDEYEKKMTEVLVDSMIPEYNSFILKDCDHKRFKTASVMVDGMVRWGQELSLSAFSALMKGLCSSRCSIKEISSLLEKMPKLSNQLDQETLNLLVQAHCKKGFTQKAKAIFDRALQKCLRMENTTYTALITSLCKKGNIKCLHHCWELARKQKWRPELKNYKALMGGLCEREMLKEALELLESMMVAHPHVVLDLCHPFLEKLCGTGCTGTARIFVEELLERGCLLDWIVYSHLVRGFYKEKRFADAFMISDIMLAKNMAPQFDVSILLIPPLCRAANYDKAVSLKELCAREQPSASLSIHCALMSGFFETDMVVEAVNVFQDMLLKGVKPEIEVYNILLQGYCRAKKFQKVGEIIGIMIRKNISISISSYRKLVFLLCMEGRIHLAISMKELMLRESSTSYSVIYNILIFYLFLSRNNVFVDKLLDELQERGLQLDEITYNFLAYGFSQCKAVSRSLHYLTTMMSKEIRPSNQSLRAIISCLCDDGDLENTLKLSREMESRGWAFGSTIQYKIVAALLENGKLEEAGRFLDRMEEKGLIPQNINYNHLINRLCCYGRIEKAVDLLDIMLKKEEIPSSTSYDCIIRGFCKCHKLDEALDFYTEMVDRDLKPSINTWNVLIANLCEDGRTLEAEMLLNSMVKLGEFPSREIYSSVINRYRFENNFSKASELLRAMQKKGYEPDFETHWSLIRNLSVSNDKDTTNNGSSHFLSRLLSNSGFSQKNETKVKLG